MKDMPRVELFSKYLIAPLLGRHNSKYCKKVITQKGGSPSQHLLQHPVTQLFCEEGLNTDRTISLTYLKRAVYCRIQASVQERPRPIFQFIWNHIGKVPCKVPGAEYLFTSLTPKYICSGENQLCFSYEN